MISDNNDYTVDDDGSGRGGRCRGVNGDGAL